MKKILITIFKIIGICIFLYLAIEIGHWAYLPK